MSDDDEVAHLVAGQEVAPAEPAEGHGEFRPGHAVHHAGQQVDTGGTVDGHDGNLEIEVRASSAASSGRGAPDAPVPSSASIARPTLGQGPSGPTSRTPSARASFAIRSTQLRSRPSRGHPHWNLDVMEGPRDHPAITTVVARPRRHEHAGTKQMWVAIRQRNGHRTPGTLHQRGELDAGS